MALKTRFCVKCGKETKKLIDGFCAECYFKESGIKIPKRLSVQICSRCNAIKWRGMWTKTDLSPDYYLTHDLISKIKLPKDAELEDVKIKKLGKKGLIEITISILGKKFTQQKSVSIEILRGTCKDCSRHLARTPKTIIQMRTHTDIEKFKRDVIEFSNMYQSNIIKVEEQKKGLDIYLSNKEAGKHLAYDLRKKFKCKMSESAKQYGWDKSKNRPLTRVTYLLKQS